MDYFLYLEKRKIEEMKKLLGILVLGLLWCNISFAKVYDFKCSQYNYREFRAEGSKEDYNRRWIIHIEIDTSKKMITMFDSWDHEEKREKRIFKINNITENAYYSGDSFLENSEKFLSFNRYTGTLIYKSRVFEIPVAHWFSCEQTEQLY